ncbi:MAG: hypothetical protein FJZ49_01975 [Candidatus Verstraetearchaeota archaeon]|nr:hypothetical protein [Candidatus Verstraetearchaeota archaeon]
MEINASEKFKRELRSFTALSVISLVFGAIAIALSVFFTVMNITPLVQLKPGFYTNAISVFLGFVAAAFSIKWLLSSTEIFSGLDDIRDESKKLGPSPDSEKLTGLIVRLMSMYRQERPTINRMILLSKLAGACFIANGVVLAISLVVGLYTGGADMLQSVAGILISLAVGAVGLYLPSSFQRYAAAWDARLQGSDSAEKELSTLVGVG